MNANVITLTQDSTPEEYAELLRGRYVTDITVSSDETSTTITLDNGTTLTMEANEGCGGCANGWYHITRAYYRGNRCARIMNARVEYTCNENNIKDGWEKYTIFVMIDGNETQLPLITAQGDDGPGGYGTGFTLTVRPANNDTNGDAREPPTPSATHISM